MNALDIITKKKLGNELSKSEIQWFVHAYTNDTIPDYQASAWLMAVCFQGMNSQESYHLTEAMVSSGDRLDLSGIKGIKIDKHSTGGVGDKTSLIVGPIVSSCGVKFPKLAGRGLGHTGGTIDKLESLPGMNVSLTDVEWINQVNEIGLAIGSQTNNLVPADKKLYALRDVTGTVENKALIASSIMSKKIATGADGIVLDVKFGLGSFLPSFEEAKELAKLMLDIGAQFRIPTCAVLSDMNEPLGHAVGNVLEVIEAIEVLKGNGEVRLTELCKSISMEMLSIAMPNASQNELMEMVNHSIESGTALEKMREWLTSQGTQVDVCSQPNLLHKSDIKCFFEASQNGYICSIHAEQIGTAARLLGAGRLKKEDQIDHGAGIVFHRKTGDRVNRGDRILSYYSNKKETSHIHELIGKAITITDDQPPAPPIVQEIMKNGL